VTDLPFTAAFTGLESKTLSAETESIGSSMQTLVPADRRPSFHGSRRRSLRVGVLLALLRFACSVVCGAWCVVVHAGSVLYVCV
jgi:hypothetical protein